MPEEASGTEGTVLDKAFVVELSIGKLGTKRKVRQRKVLIADAKVGTDEEALDEDPQAQVAANQPQEDMLHVSKEILRCGEYEAIVSEDNAIKRDIAALALRSTIVLRGAYLVPLDLVERVDQVLTAYKARRKVAIDAFMAVYEKAREDAKTSLGTLYDPADYPATSLVRDSFRVRVRWVTFAVPGRLSTVSRAIYDRETKRVKEELAQASEEIKVSMRAAFADLVEHMAERLTPEPDGKVKTFKRTTLDKMLDFLDTFQARNISSDAELAAVVGQARELLAGADVLMIRKEPLHRSHIAAGINRIKTAIDGLVETRGRRFAWAQEPQIKEADDADAAFG